MDYVFYIEIDVIAAIVYICIMQNFQYSMLNWINIHNKRCVRCWIINDVFIEYYSKFKNCVRITVKYTELSSSSSTLLPFHFSLVLNTFLIKSDQFEFQTNVEILNHFDCLIYWQAKKYWHTIDLVCCLLNM